MSVPSDKQFSRKGTLIFEKVVCFMKHPLLFQFLQLFGEVIVHGDQENLLVKIIPGAWTDRSGSINSRATMDVLIYLIIFLEFRPLFGNVNFTEIR